MYCSRLFYSNHVNQLVFRFLENYLQRFNKLTNKDRDENNKEKTTCDIKVTEDLQNRGEIVIDEINTIAEEIVSMDDHSLMDDQNSNNSVKKGKKESQKKQVERRKKEGMIIEVY